MTDRPHFRRPAPPHFHSAYQSFYTPFTAQALASAHIVDTRRNAEVKVSQAEPQASEPRLARHPSTLLGEPFRASQMSNWPETERKKPRRKVLPRFVSSLHLS